MTSVQTSYQLLRKLDDTDAEAGISEVHGYYGIRKIQIAPELDRITVEYDATRLSPSDLDNVLVRFGVPIVATHQGD